MHWGEKESTSTLHGALLPQGGTAQCPEGPPQPDISVTKEGERILSERSLSQTLQDFPKRQLFLAVARMLQVGLIQLNG